MEELNTKTKIYKAALVEVNLLRREHGIGGPLDRLPKGKWGDGTSCPIQRALNCLQVDDMSIVWDGCESATPDEIAYFIMAFDDHEYPELEI